MMQMLTEDEVINKDTFIQLFEEIFNAGILCCENKDGYPILSAEGNLPSILGYQTENELLEKNKFFSSLIIEEDLSSVLEVLDEVLSGKNSFSIEFRGRKNDGQTVWLHGVIVYLKNTGHILFSFIKAVESLWNRIFRLLPCGICRVAGDEVFTILQANEIYYDIYGYTSKEAIDIGFTNEKFIIYPDDFKAVHKEVEEYLKDTADCIFEMEHRVIRKNQQIGWVLVKAYIDRTAQGNYLNCVLLDISDRKNAEEALRISEEQTRIAFLSTENDMEIYNVRSRILECPYVDSSTLENPCQIENVPYSIIAKGLVEGDSIKDYMYFFDSIINGAPDGRCTVQLKKEKDETFHWYEIKYSMIFDSLGTPERAILSYKDITTQREKELAYEKWSHFFDLQKETSLGYYEYNLTKNIYAGKEEELLNILPDYIRSFTEAVTYFFETCIYEQDKEKYRAFYNRERLLAEYYSGKKMIILNTAESVLPAKYSGHQEPYS